MKTLICLSPQLRGEFTSEAMDSLVEHVVRHLPEKPDAIGYFAPPERNETRILDQVCGSTEWVFADDPEFRKRDLGSSYGLISTNRTRNNLLQWHALSKLEAMVDKLEKAAGSRYDLIIWTRPDLYFVQGFELPEKIEPNTLWISPHDNWRSYNDRFCYGSSQTMRTRMKVFEHYQRYFKHRTMLRSLGDPLLGRLIPNYRHDSRWNAESVLASLIRKHGIEVRSSNAFFFRIRDDNGRAYVMLSDPSGDAGGPFKEGEEFNRQLQDFTEMRVRKLHHSGRLRNLSYDSRKRFVDLQEIKEFWYEWSLE